MIVDLVMVVASVALAVGSVCGAAGRGSCHRRPSGRDAGRCSARRRPARTMALVAGLGSRFC